MATFRRIEEIEAWQKARALVRKIYSVSRTSEFSKDFGLRDQIRRASVSILSNIAEGFERDGTGEFAQFLAVAKGSAGEVKAQIYVALDQAYITQQQFEGLMSDVNETARMIKGLMTYLKKTKIRGTKYKGADDDS